MLSDVGHVVDTAIRDRHLHALPRLRAPLYRIASVAACEVVDLAEPAAFQFTHAARRACIAQIVDLCISRIAAASDPAAQIGLPLVVAVLIAVRIGIGARAIMIGTAVDAVVLAAFEFTGLALVVLSVFGMMGFEAKERTENRGARHDGDCRGSIPSLVCPQSVCFASLTVITCPREASSAMQFLLFPCHQ